MSVRSLIGQRHDLVLYGMDYPAMAERSPRYPGACKGNVRERGRDAVLGPNLPWQESRTARTLDDTCKVVRI